MCIRLYNYDSIYLLVSNEEICISRSPRSSEADASELLEDLEIHIPRYYMHSIAGSNLQS